MLILDLWGISFHAVVVFGLCKNFLFKSALGHCVHALHIQKCWRLKYNESISRFFLISFLAVFWLLAQLCSAQARREIFQNRGGQKSSAKSRDEHIQTWQKVTKKLVVAKKVIGERKKMKRMWKENYTGMCNRAIVLGSDFVFLNFLSILSVNFRSWK